MNERLRVVPLGGLGEVGMNCLALELDQTIVVIDCGVTFPDREPGVDIIRPDFTYLRERAAQVSAVVLTHGHEDHIGALPYLLSELDVPVYGPQYALSLLRERLAEIELETAPRLHALTPRRPVEIGAFEIEPYRVTHSIPDSTGLVIRTRVGTLIHTGDFKIDPSPPDDAHFDIAFVSLVGAQGVRLLMSDSTNVDVEGVSGSEARVAETLRHHIELAPGRVVLSMFGSNVYRMAAALKVARDLGKQTLLLGRSVRTHARLAEAHGLLPRPLPTLIAPELAQRVDPAQLLVLASGSQGEPKAALARVAARTHHHLRLAAGDTVLLSSRIIPGRERAVHTLIDDLERQGVRVLQRYDEPLLHVSGHACRGEQREILALTKPRAFLPVHGTFHHLQRHASLARELGVPEVFVIENGQTLELDEDETLLGPTFEAGRVHVQAQGDLSDVVLRDRALIAENGIAVVTLQVDADGALRERPALLTRGIVWEDEEEALLDSLTEQLEHALRRLPLPCSDETLKDATCRLARRFFRDAVGFRPLTHCVITGRQA